MTEKKHDKEERTGKMTTIQQWMLFNNNNYFHHGLCTKFCFYSRIKHKEDTKMCTYHNSQEMPFLLMLINVFNVTSKNITPALQKKKKKIKNTTWRLSVHILACGP